MFILLCIYLFTTEARLPQAQLTNMLLKDVILIAGVFVTSVSATTYYAGVAESGGEFGVWCMCS